MNKIEKDFHEQNRPLTIELLKEKLDVFFKGDATKTDANDFFNFAESIVKAKEQKQRNIYLKQTLRILKEFSYEAKFRIDFETINNNFYDLFFNFLNTKEFSINTRAKHIGNIKYFMTKGLERELHNNIKYKTFKAPKERIDNIYLNETEIQKLYNLDLSIIPRLEKVRDLFLIGCYTGLRFSDLSKIAPSNITNNKIIIKTQKTGKLVEIPLRVEAREIINKYNGSVPKAISSQKMNDYLKEIAQHAGLNETIVKYHSKGAKIKDETKYKYELVCTHTARRSFATNMYKAGFSAKQIMLITGHTTESEFFKYIKINESENAELLLNSPYFNQKLKIAK